MCCARFAGGFAGRFAGEFAGGFAAGFAGGFAGGFLPCHSKLYQSCSFTSFPPHPPPPHPQPLSPSLSFSAFPLLSSPLLLSLPHIIPCLPLSLSHTHTHLLHSRMLSSYYLLPSVYAVFLYAIFSILWKILPTFVWTIVYYLLLIELFLSTGLAMVHVIRLWLSNLRP